MSVSWLYLMLAIVLELVGTAALKASAGFTRPLPVAMVVVGYLSAFYLLSLTLRTIPMGVAYAVWSGVGIVGITIIGALGFKEIPNTPTLIGIGLILAGVVVVNLAVES